MKKSNSLQHSLILSVVAIFVAGMSGQPAAAQETDPPAREYYELRIYRVNDFEKQALLEEYLQMALMPALGRQGIDRIGVFTDMEDYNDHSVYVLIPYPTMDSFAGCSDALLADEDYQTTAAPYFDRTLDDPLYSRIESRFLKAFAGIPVMEIPEASTNSTDRIFELRLYESHTEGHATRKIDMFNDGGGEIQIMRDAGLAPVFFGETLIGQDAPNLIYMLSAESREAHDEHWKAFIDHPEWKRIKDLPEYKDTVSAIHKWFLTPTPYSQL
ncbi:MAG: NIPSNAP family protein [Planctomycetota bacterium]